MKTIKTLTILFICSDLFFGCGQRTAKQNTSADIEDASIIENMPIVKDSIDILIEQRAEQSNNSTIIAGLRFGEKRWKVENVLRKREYSIQVPNGDKVDNIIIRDYDAVYNNDELVSLLLYADEANLYDALGVLYTTKYGKTKNNDWLFSNCEISIEKRARRLWNEYPKSNRNTPDMYYKSYRGADTKYLTKEQFFLAIRYINYDLQRKMERQIYVRDSIERKRHEKEAEIKRQQEKELAKKLSTEPATNI